MPTLKSFRKTIQQYYRLHARKFPWRETHDPYRILVSEIMLQQTQTSRVMQKYEPFLEKFPSFPALASAPLREVLHAWQGLGYNRRALALKKTAEIIIEKYSGKLLLDEKLLEELPGIGPSTAGAVLAFAFNKPTVFIETNIRRVFIHFFFKKNKTVSDDEIRPLIGKNMDRKNPRGWYYALMDYGAMLKSKLPNPNRKSAHYAKQSPFENSHRQARGKILKAILEHDKISEERLLGVIKLPRTKIKEVVDELAREGFIKKRGRELMLA